MMNPLAADFALNSAGARHVPLRDDDELARDVLQRAQQMGTGSSWRFFQRENLQKVLGEPKVVAMTFKFRRTEEIVGECIVLQLVCLGELPFGIQQASQE